MPKMPTLTCPRCATKGRVQMTRETVGVGKAEPLDLHLYACLDCGDRWYDACDVIALVVSYGANLGATKP
jgi:hypothetical protein